MNVNEYKIKYSSDLNAFLTSEAGKNLIPVLHQLRPLFVTNSSPHVHTESSGAVRGYENCEKAIIFLSLLPAASDEIEMTYGIPSRKEK